MSTLILTDDVYPALIIFGDATESTSPLHPSLNSLHEHNRLLRYLVQQDALRLQDCFPSDVPRWEGYGVCAFKYGPRFEVATRGLVQDILPTSVLPKTLRGIIRL